MANNLVTGAFGQVPAAIREELAKSGGRPADELGAGITQGFAVVTYRGKVFRVKHRGEETAILRDDGDPVSSIETVIIKASPHLSKIFYVEGYVEGSTAPPDCWSVDGVKPELASPKRQAEQCLGCPHNAFGSGRNGKGKACADSKRLAVVPLNDLDNDAHGGPMLLRVPPASLGAIRGYADTLNGLGFPQYAVGTRIGFDVAAQYPSLTFKAIRALTEEESAKVLALRKDPRIDRILNTAPDHVETNGSQDVKPTMEDVFEQPPVVQPSPARPTQPTQQGPARPQLVPPPAPKPTPVSAPARASIPAAPNPVQASEQRKEQVEERVEEVAQPAPVNVEALRAAGLTDEQIKGLVPASASANGANGSKRGRPKKADEPPKPAPEPEDAEVVNETPDLPEDFEALLREVMPS